MAKKDNVVCLQKEVKELKALVDKFNTKKDTHQISTAFKQALNESQYNRIQIYILIGVIVMTILLVFQIFSLFMLAE